MAKTGKKELTEVRIDKYLWAVRIVKTRHAATALCSRGGVTIEKEKAKASRLVRVGMVIAVKVDGLRRTFEVIGVIEKRIGAKCVAQYCMETTPQEDIDLHAAIKRMPVPRRPRGAGRPTKKERRELEGFVCTQ